MSKRFDIALIPRVEEDGASELVECQIVEVLHVEGVRRLAPQMVDRHSLIKRRRPIVEYTIGVSNRVQLGCWIEESPMGSAS